MWNGQGDSCSECETVITESTDWFRILSSGTIFCKTCYPTKGIKLPKGKGRQDK